MEAQDAEKNFPSPDYSSGDAAEGSEINWSAVPFWFMA